MHLPLQCLRYVNTIFISSVREHLGELRPQPGVLLHAHLHRRHHHARFRPVYPLFKVEVKILIVFHYLCFKLPIQGQHCCSSWGDNILLPLLAV